MNAKMKVLSLALVGLCGFAGSAMAACPAGPTTAEGGAWSGKTQTAGAVAIATPGYDGTECRMTSTLNAGATAFAAATVRDDSPSNEPRYRAQFLVNADGITNLGTFESVQIFAAQSAALYLNSGIMVRFAISGGANKLLNVIAANQNGGTNVSSTTLPLTAGTNRVEFDLQTGANGSVSIWLNNGNSAAPTATLTNLNNAGWVGVDRAVMGLSAANNLFRTNHGGQSVSFDQFDSRRQTFIGTP